MIAARALLAAILALAEASLPFAEASAVEQVDLELVIATDVSFSIDMEEARLQRQGIIAAFRSPEVIDAIRGGALGRIAVAYMDFSSRPYNKLVIDWQVIEDQASAEAFAAKLAAAPPGRGQSTSISDALEMAASLIEGNPFEGTRRVIDVSGDGPNNAGRRVDIVRDDVLSKGITINGLPIINLADQWNSRYFLPDLDRYFEGCVTGGAGSSVVVAHDFQDFARAIRQKLILEMAGRMPKRSAPRPQMMRASAGVMRAQSITPGGPPYEKGCDIGEKLRWGGWGGTAYPPPDLPER
jgi:hypothetical protein